MENLLEQQQLNDRIQELYNTKKEELGGFEVE